MIVILPIVIATVITCIALSIQLELIDALVNCLKEKQGATSKYNGMQLAVKIFGYGIFFNLILSFVPIVPQVIPFLIGTIFNILTLVTICVEDKNNRIGEKSRKVDALLCFFLGWLGIHRFYEGKIIIGILYILTLGFFGIGWLMDLLIIVGGDAVDKKGRSIVRWNNNN